MSDIDQLAAEAADRWDDAVYSVVQVRLDAKDKAELQAIIKSAIEKATEPLWSEINRLTDLANDRWNQLQEQRNQNDRTT